MSRVELQKEYDELNMRCEGLKHRLLHDKDVKLEERRLLIEQLSNMYGYLGVLAVRLMK